MNQKQITKAVEEFIRKRFPVDCNWKSGNCYYFAVMLNARFPEGRIYYDVINGHFALKIGEKFYDFSGETVPDFAIAWDSFQEYDALRYKRVIRDCIK